jgi:hypothetical protein
MPKLTLTDIESGYASVDVLNANFTAIETALENTLSRDGTTPNTLTADLDLNGNDLINVGDALVGGVSLAASVAAADASADAAAVSAAAALVSENNAAADAVIAADAAFELEDLEYRGAWVAATAYLKNNIVYYSTDGASYICLTSHTANANFAVDLGAARWGLLALRGAAGAGTGDMLKSENLSGLANYTTARSNMGLAIGTNVQAYDADLAAIAALTPTDSNFIVGNGSAWVAESGATARTSLGAAAEASTQTIYIPAGAMKADPTAGPSTATVELANGPNITTLNFDKDTDEFAQFSIRMPKGWNEGTVTFVPSWSHAATTVDYGVAWFLQAVAVGNNETLDVAFGTPQSSVDTGGDTNYLYFGPASSAITIAGSIVAEDLVQFQIYRDVSDAGDTLAVDARLHGITIYYTTTSLNDA